MHSCTSKANNLMHHSVKIPLHAVHQHYREYRKSTKKIYNFKFFHFYQSKERGTYMQEKVALEKSYNALNKSIHLLYILSTE